MLFSTYPNLVLLQQVSPASVAREQSSPLDLDLSQLPIVASHGQHLIIVPYRNILP